VTALTEFYLDYLDYRAAFAASSFAPYLRPLSFGDWLKFWNVWSVNHAGKILEELKNPATERECADLLYAALRAMADTYTDTMLWRIERISPEKLDAMRANAALRAGFALGAYEMFRKEQETRHD
jgi:hypothetical protein